MRPHPVGGRPVVDTFVRSVLALADHTHFRHIVRGLYPELEALRTGSGGGRHGRA
jgi:hypothetical protein